MNPYSPPSSTTSAGKPLLFLKSTFFSYACLLAYAARISIGQPIDCYFDDCDPVGMGSGEGAICFLIRPLGFLFIVVFAPLPLIAIRRPWARHLPLLFISFTLISFAAKKFAYGWTGSGQCAPWLPFFDLTTPLLALLIFWLLNLRTENFAHVRQRKVKSLHITED